MKRLEHHLEKILRRLESQPLPLLLVAIYLMGGMMKRVQKSLPAWAVQSL